MKITLFAKKRTSNEGKVFYNYLATLVRKSTGETIPVQVKFREACGSPDPHKCPCYIEVNSKDANLSSHTIETDSGSKTVNILWVTKWAFAGEYVDNSMEDIDAC